MYIQRYLAHFPAAGEVVVFDRSWYNRAGVEQVMGFCTPAETERFLELVPGIEKAMVDSGILLLKYWLEVSADEQARRLQSRIRDPRKIWKLSDMDLKSYSRWYDYSRARTRCSPRLTPRGGPGTSRTPTTRARPAQHHQPPAQPGPLQAARAPGRHAAQAAAGGRLRGAGPAVAVHSDAVLDGQARRIESLAATLARGSCLLAGQAPGEHHGFRRLHGIGPDYRGGTPACCQHMRIPPHGLADQMPEAGSANNGARWNPRGARLHRGRTAGALGTRETHRPGPALSPAYQADRPPPGADCAVKALR